MALGSKMTRQRDTAFIDVAVNTVFTDNSQCLPLIG